MDFGVRGLRGGKGNCAQWAHFAQGSSRSRWSPAQAGLWDVGARVVRGAVNSGAGGAVDVGGWVAGVPLGDVGEDGQALVLEVEVASGVIHEPLIRHRIRKRANGLFGCAASEQRRGTRELIRRPSALADDDGVADV